MKNLTRAQAEAVRKLETLLGCVISTKPLSRSVFLVNLPDGDRCGFSRLETLICRLAHQYGLGRVEPSGVDRIAVISN